MRRTIRLIAGAMMGIALLASCQSKSYRLEGSGEALKDGDTLFLTTDLTELTPSDTIVVKDGKFAITGETDSTYFCHAVLRGAWYCQDDVPGEDGERPRRRYTVQRRVADGQRLHSSHEPEDEPAGHADV